jgi:phage-related protein
MPKLMSPGMIAAKHVLDPQGPWVTLYKLNLNPPGESNPTLYRRIVNHPRAIVYGGEEYLPFPVRHEGIREEAQGRLQRITVQVANVSREIQDLLEAHDGLRGKHVTLIAINLDQPDLGDVRQTFIIDSVTAGDQVVSITLGKPIPIMDVKLPKRLIFRDLFPAVMYT